MSWPLVSDFSRMLQNPKVAFRDPAMRMCRIETDGLGQPRARSGNFATVFRAYREDGSELAVRVFNRGVDARREAYQLRSRYMEGRQVNSLVPFHYDEKGIRSAADGRLYPLLTMDWVPGVTLFEWVRDRCGEGYREALAIGADVWLYLVRELAENGIVHGDLQHGNVLVSPEGHFKLVDYDCLAVPDLMGRSNLELGLVPYQHPRRSESTALFPGLDNFSALVIYVALRALAAAPVLWTRYVQEPGYDKLLFRSADFSDPEGSALYRDLLSSPDMQVRDLAYYLFKLTVYELEDVPPIDEVLLWSNSLEDLLARKDWDTAVQLVQRMGADEPVPESLRPLVAEAERRVAARAALEQALRMGSEWEVQQRYVPALLDDYPAAAELVKEAQQAAKVVQVLEALNVAKRFGKWDLFRELWNADQARLAKRPSARPYRLEMTKLWAADSVGKLLADPTVRDQAVIEAWKYLQSLGGHPTAEVHAAAVREREQRVAAAVELRQWVERAGPVATLESDRQLVAAWQHSGLDGSAAAAPLAEPCRAAAARLASLKRLHELAPTCSIEGEKEISRLSGALPDDYHPHLARRRRRARQRLTALAALNAALHKPRSDTAIVEAWKKIRRAKAEPMVTEAVRHRIRLASLRVPILKGLAAIEVRLSDVEMDRQLLAIWDDRLLSTCHDAQGWLPRYRQARERQQLLQQIAEAVAQVDKPRLGELLAHPSLAGYPLDIELTHDIAGVDEKLRQRRLAHRQNIVRALLENQPSVFADLFDAELVREICHDSPHHRQLAQRWTESEILPPGKSGLAPGDEGGLIAAGQSMYHAVWKWPRPNVSTRCLLAVCREPPRASAAPDDVEALYRATVDRAESDGPEVRHALVAPAEWAGASVVVWAEINLGFQFLYTEPLELGRIEHSVKSRRWGLFH